MQYNHILESIDNLPIKQQIRLVEIIRQRIIDRKRAMIAENYEIAINDYSQNILFEESATELIQRLSETNK